jgi:LmbE family N-acetylglucosaminyl deacetylase
MARTVLFVCAHQDDEVAFATRILHERYGGAQVSVVFLCDGGNRNEESRRALTYLGVDDVRFLEGIDDGHLVEHLEEAFEKADTPAHAVYALAYEGGHHDHDAAHLVAAAIASKHGADCIEMPLYRAARFGPFFRVLSPIGGGWRTRRVPPGDAWRAFRLIFFYRSQWKTWFALTPEGIWHLPFEHTRPARRSEPRRRYYERRFRFPYERFTRLASPFVERHRL